MQPHRKKQSAAPTFSKLRTHISQVYWCDPAQGYRFYPAHIKLPSQDHAQEIGWLDELLDGGFSIPTQGGDRKQALGVLITGPPGTGKSTLALELAYRWSFQTLEDCPAKSLQILYATLEASPESMINNAGSYMWLECDKRLKAIQSLVEMEQGKVNIVRFDNLPALDPANNQMEGRTILDSLYEHIKAIADAFGNRPSPTELAEATIRPPDVLIIDSLNSVPNPTDRQKLFLQYSRFVKTSPLIVIFILDSSPDDGRAEFWEFASDTVIRLDRQYDNSGYMGYMIRNIEILKARFQQHAWGRHQLKIYKGSTRGNSTVGVQSENVALAAERMRAHPYRNEGGLFIFPSIHFVLSAYKHAVPFADHKLQYYEPKVANLNKLLGIGFPIGRCTALIGERGGHKSHLGYVELLHRLVFPHKCIHDMQAQSNPVEKQSDPVEKALIVSLRDDEGMTRQTLTKILEMWANQSPAILVPTLAQLEKSGKLEITFFPPGYITPEEFFHRLLLSINRLKHTSKAKHASVTLLFNSLDQLSSRFPLCAKEPIFIPGILQMLAGEGVSSFFVAAREEGRSDYYGLDSMAELILEFQHRYFKKGNKKRKSVVVTVERYAGGQAAGAEGVLELLENGDLICTPL